MTRWAAAVTAIALAGVAAIWWIQRSVPVGEPGGDRPPQGYAGRPEPRPTTEAPGDDRRPSRRVTPGDNGQSPPSPAPADERRGSPAAGEPARRRQRIVSLVPAVTQMLFAMGAGREVVAVSSFDRRPPEVASLPRVGALLDPDVERILSLRPTLVVMYASQVDLREQLERARLALYEYRHGTLADITGTIRAIGKRIDYERPAEALARAIEERLARVRARVERQPRPTVLLVFGRETGTLRNIQVSGGYGFLNDMLVAAGGANVFADIPRESVQATSELLLARKPQVIIELRATGLSPGAMPGPGRPSVPSGPPDPAWSTLSSIPAVRDGRIHVLAGDQYVVPGPDVADTVEQLSRILHP